jgi:hypothetical protein
MNLTGRKNVLGGPRVGHPCRIYTFQCIQKCSVTFCFSGSSCGQVKYWSNIWSTLWTPQTLRALSHVEYSSDCTPRNVVISAFHSLLPLWVLLLCHHCCCNDQSRNIVVGVIDIHAWAIKWSALQTTHPFSSLQPLGAVSPPITATVFEIR